MKALFIIIICISVGNMLGVETANLSLEEKMRAVEISKFAFERSGTNELLHARLQNLANEDRELLLRWLREQVAERRARGERESEIRGGGLDRNLALLGDDWGLQVFADEFHGRPSSDWSYRFEEVRNAKLIFLVGDLLFKNEDYTFSDDLGFFPAQVTTAQGIIETLKYAPQFQTDMNQWGQELYDAYRKRNGQVLGILREWYRANEDKLHAQAFADIRPGRTPKPAVSTAPAASVPANAPQMPPAPSVSIPAPVAAVPRAEPKGYLVEIIAAAAVGLLGVLIFLWKRRTH